MKSKYLAAALSTMIFSCGAISAENYTKSANLVSKSALPFYRASGITTQTLPGSATAAFSTIAFPRHAHKHADGISKHDKGTKFVLDKGSYQIAFTASVESTAGISVLDFGLRLGSKVRDVFTKSIEAGFDRFQIVTTTVTIHLDKKTKLSLVTRNRQAGTSARITRRVISIVKLA